MQRGVQFEANESRGENKKYVYIWNEYSLEVKKGSSRKNRRSLSTVFVAMLNIFLPGLK